MLVFVDAQNRQNLFQVSFYIKNFLLKMDNIIKNNEKRSRARSCNWEEEEKTILMKLIAEEVKIIECKDSSSNINKTKKASWEKVLQSFNTLNKRKRTFNQIITQWRNTKNILKNKKSEFMRLQKITGGGPPPPSPEFDPQEIQIMSMIPNEFVVDNNPFDSDGNQLKKVKMSPTAEDKNDSEGVALHTEPEVDFVPDIVTNTPSREQNPKGYTKIKATPKRKRDDDYEKQLFLLAQEARIKAMSFALVEHQKKMEILELERQYWQQKINNETKK